jgi:hypothetical protein
MTTDHPPPVRKERKISVITLAWPVTAKIHTIGIYKFDANGWLRLMRVLHGCRVEG